MQPLQQDTNLQGGKYIIKKVLGQGGFGITYLAENTMLEGKVAIKEFFFKEYCSRDEETSIVSIPIDANKEIVDRYKQKFIKEARTIFKLNHPNIVRIHDIFEENGTAYYVMDYIDGESLGDMVKLNGAIPEAEAVRYIKETASALSYIHDKNINHLDIKPSNIMRCFDDNRILLIDFGVSKQYDAVTAEAPTTTPVGISHGYSPTEQYRINGVQTFSPQSDVYSLAATLFKLLTGITPPDANEVRDEGLPVDELQAKGISSCVASAIINAMKGKHERTQSVQEFIIQLETPFEKQEEHSNKDNIQTINQEKDTSSEDTVPIIDPIFAERERLLKEAQEKAEKEARIKAEKERIKKEEERKRKESENKEKTNSGYWMLVAFGVAFALIIGGFVLSQNKAEGVDNVDVVEDNSNIEKRTIKVNFTTTPTNADVYIDGSRKGCSPFSIAITPGIHKIKIIKEGYKTIESTEIFGTSDFTDSFTLKKEEPQFAPIDIPSKTKPSYSVTFSTNVENAAIYVDGKYLGNIKNNVRLSPGKHRIFINSSGYSSYEGMINVDEKHTYFYIPLNRITSNTSTTSKAATTTYKTQGTAKYYDGTPLYGIVVRALKSKKTASVDKNGHFEFDTNLSNDDILQITVDNRTYTQKPSTSVRFVAYKNIQKTISVHGKIVDKNGEAMVGVAIKIDGSTRGTISDIDGVFELSDVPEDAYLQFSYLKYKTVYQKAQPNIHLVYHKK